MAMTETIETDRPNLFDKYMQFPEDEFDWVDCKDDLDQTMTSGMAEDDGTDQ